jgi:hypothetical protein
VFFTAFFICAQYEGKSGYREINKLWGWEQLRDFNFEVEYQKRLVNSIQQETKGKKDAV